MYGLAIRQQNNTKKFTIGFRDGRPAAYPSIRLNHFFVWMFYCSLYPFEPDALTIRASAHRLKILGEFHGVVVSVPEMTIPCKYHRQPMLVRSRDHFFVAQRAARLDHGLCACLRQHVDAVAEREEGIG